MKKDVTLEKKKSEKVDVYNDHLMVTLQLRQPPLDPRDESVWTKSEEEKKELKKFRKLKFDLGNWGAPKKIIPIPGKLIVQVRGFKKTTYSHNCIQSSIPSILNKYKENGDIIKYSWNGKTYAPDVLPFWY